MEANPPADSGVKTSWPWSTKAWFYWHRSIWFAFLTLTFVPAKNTVATWKAILFFSPLLGKRGGMGAACQAAVMFFYPLSYMSLVEWFPPFYLLTCQRLGLAVLTNSKKQLGSPFLSFFAPLWPCHVLWSPSELSDPPPAGNLIGAQASFSSLSSCKDDWFQNLFSDMWP